MASFRVRDPVVQDRLDQDYVQHPLVVRMNTLDQGDMTDAQYILQKRNYLVFLIAHHYYEAYLLQREGIQRKEHLQKLRAKKPGAARGPGIGAALGVGVASADSLVSTTTAPGSLTPTVSTSDTKTMKADVLTTLSSTDTYGTSVSSVQPSTGDSVSLSADTRKTTSAKRK
ncbi:small capsid protein [Colobine gammaherpesvirus 1]|uniref:Small capsomere-interacting protein n=1 Tax=Colobine gammaherpesvirus 1 TaxID=2597325 RepID=A0A5B8FKE3_9GAMA|nr:small capsid protein [Colobine gammaherpesvirus 1]QDQ69276.1 small capsid protein [Colobine gammaherpesvirus 1]